MDRALRTILASLAGGTLLLALLLPGRPAARLARAVGASVVALLCLAGGFLAAQQLLQGGWLNLATALGLLTVAAVIQLPAWLLARSGEVEVQQARGAVLFTAVVVCFVAAWVAGPRLVAEPSSARELHPAPPLS
jgi:hypothetical protein